MAKESAKKKNTSKTARVLGLLTSPPPTEEPLKPAAPGSKPKTETAAPKSADDKVIEAQIRDALASELADPRPSTEEPAPAVEAEPVIQPPAILTEPDIQPLLDEGPVPILTDGPELQPPVLSEEPAPTLAEEPVAQPPLLREEPAPALMDDAAVQPPPSPEEPALIRPQSERAEHAKPIVFQAHPDHIQDTGEGFICFNVMQALVEAKTDKYIKLFGLCTCSRCRTDVVALALTNLPAKYLVATSKEMVPLLSVYEGQYSAAVISQVMNACRRVMAHPRHRKNPN